MRKTLIFLISFFICGVIYSQKQGNHWYFGNYAGLDFSSGNPVPVFDGMLNTSEGSASVSDVNGNLLFYTDGMTVYDKNNNPMPNGTGLYGNPSSTQSAVICPKPGTWNPVLQHFDSYIICTIDYNKGTHGVCWSEVDMTVNGGLGDVVASTKNTHLIGSTTVEAATFAKKKNSCDYWLITKEVGNNTWKVFPVTASGVGATPVISTIGPTMGNAIGSIKASPNGNIIAIANSTAGIHVYDFNSSTGQMMYKYGGNTLSGSYYSIEYSPNNRYLYLSLLSNANIYQFDLNSINAASFLGSRTVVGTTSNSHPASSYNYMVGTLQIAPNGKIYLALENSTYLGVINSPNLGGVACNYIDKAVNIAGTNTNNSQPTLVKLGLPSFPSFFFNNSIPHIQYRTYCSSDSVQLSLTDYQNINSYKWFVTPVGTSASNPQSTDSIYKLELSPGQYAIKTFLGYQCYGDTVFDTITIFPKNISVMVDSTICRGDTIQLSASSNGTVLSYEWSPSLFLNDSSLAHPLAYPPTTTNYTVTMRLQTSDNLVVNGDFESGNVNFNSDYVYNSGSTIGPGSYTVNTTNTGKPWWAGCGDHTTGSGNMLIVDGASNGGNGVPTGAALWCQTIAITPNTDYAFSIWFTNINANLTNNYPANAELGFFINGTQVGPTQTLQSSANICQWKQLYQIWNSGNNTTATICIKELGGGDMGNDFAIDDIAFYQICSKNDVVKVNVDTVNSDFDIVNTCGDPQTQLMATSTTNANGEMNFQWDFNGDENTDATDDSLGHVFGVGAHPISLITETENGCSDTITKAMQLLPTDLFAGNDTIICKGTTAQLKASSGAEVLGYSWSPVATLNDPTIKNPVASPDTTTDYIVTSTVVSSGNLIVNGDFSSGDSAFTSEYLSSGNNPLGGPGHYYVGTTITNGWWGGCGDHTTGTGNMIIADGANGTDNVLTQASIWCQTIEVTPHTDYAFSAWLTNANSTSPPSELGFFINGTQIGNTQNTVQNMSCDWNQFYVTWNSGNNTTINLCIKEMSGQQPGNDFALDDISFRQLCTVTDTVRVKVDSVIANFSVPNMGTCIGDTSKFVDMSVSAFSGSKTWEWELGDGGTVAGTNSVTHKYTDTGTYTAKLTVSDSIGCSDSIQLPIIVHPLPNPTINPVPDLCVYDTPVTLTGNPSGGTFSGVGVNNNQFDPSITGDGSHTITYHYTDAFGCSNDTTAKVTVNPSPVAGFTPQNVTIHENEEIQFTNTSTGANQYHWSFGDGLGASSDKNPTYIYQINQSGTYQVVLIATSPDQCSDTTKGTITILPAKMKYKFPNIFTPNNDGQNDYFKLVYFKNIKEIDIVILNRWGNPVFESNSIDFQWNGEKNNSGSLCDDGTYFYKAVLTSFYAKKINVTGFVHLVREK